MRNQYFNKDKLETAFDQSRKDKMELYQTLVSRLMSKNYVPQDAFNNYKLVLKKNLKEEMDEDK